MVILGDEKSGVDLHLRAIELWPKFTDAWISLGKLYLELGRMEEGKQALLEGLDINPKATVAYLLLAQAGYYRDQPGDVQQMVRLFDKAVMTDSQRSYLAFALATIHEGKQAFAQAFEYFARGNRLHRKGYRYAIVDESKKFAQLKTVFSAEFLSRPAAKREAELTPIFIVGMPRSGTSLVEQILASHPDVFAVGELPMFATLCHGLDDLTGSTFPLGVDEFPPSVFDNLGTQYLEELARRSGGKTFVTDKLPSNFIHIGMIRRALPNAIIIHCCRDAMANCVSIYRNHFAAGLAYGYDQDELGQYFRLYQDLMRHWHRVAPGAVYDIAYEDLVADTQQQVHDLLAHCGLTYDAACLEFHKTSRAVRTISNDQVRRPIYRDANSAWKRYEHDFARLAESLGQWPADS